MSLVSGEKSNFQFVSTTASRASRHILSARLVAVGIAKAPALMAWPSTAGLIGVSVY